MSPNKRFKNRRYKTTLFDEEDDDAMGKRSHLENSQRLQESGARLVDESYNREVDEDD